MRYRTITFCGDADVILAMDAFRSTLASARSISEASGSGARVGRSAFVCPYNSQVRVLDTAAQDDLVRSAMLPLATPPTQHGIGSLSCAVGPRRAPL